MVRDSGETHAHSSAAFRMRRYRQRRRQGMHCVTVVLRPSQIERLIQKGWLPRAERMDQAAVGNALFSYLADNLG